MKITKQRLREIIRKELKEFTGTGGGTRALSRQKSAKSDVSTKTKTRSSKQSAKTSKKSTLDTKTADYDTKTAAVDTTKRYRKAGIKPGTFSYRPTSGKGWSTNPDYSSQVSARDSALTAKNTAQSEFDTASTNLETAISNLSAAEKAELQAYIDTNMGFGGGKGGKGKAGSEDDK